MNICEGCIKQDTCKFKERVEDEYETWRNNTGRFILKEPLGISVSCKYKQLKDLGYVSIPSVWPDWDTYTPYLPTSITTTVSPLPNSTTDTTLFRNDMPWTYTYKRA